MNPVERGHLRCLIAELCIPLLLVGALDLGFGWYAARTPSVPVPQLFGAMLTTSGKFLALRQRARHQSRLDVLFLGMSPMMRVDGLHLEAALSARARRAVATFNFSGPYHSVAYDQRLLRDVVSPLAEPAVVVYGLTPLALLNENVPAAQIDARADALPVFGMYTGSLAARLRGFVMMHVALLRHREVIRDALEPPLGWKTSAFSTAARTTSAAGDIPLRPEPATVVRLSAWERQHQRRFEDFDAVLRDTLLFDHLAQFAQFCRQHDIELVLLNNPVHPLFLDVLPRGREDYDRYRARLREGAARAQVRLLELTPDGLGPANLYRDVVHHDPAGGVWLTAEIERALSDAHLLDPGS